MQAERKQRECTAEDSTGEKMGPQVFGSGLHQIPVAATGYRFTAWHELAEQRVGALLSCLPSLPSHPSYLGLFASYRLQDRSLIHFSLPSIWRV